MPWLPVCFRGCLGTGEGSPGPKAAKYALCTQDLVANEERGENTFRPTIVQTPSVSLLEVQHQRFGGLEPHVLLVQLPPGPETYAAFANAAAAAVFGPGDVLGLLREREPYLLDSLLVHLRSLGSLTQPEHFGSLSLYFDAATYASKARTWSWAFAVASPCTLVAPRSADLRRTTSRLTRRLPTPITLDTLPSGHEDGETVSLLALLVRFAPAQHSTSPIARPLAFGSTVTVGSSTRPHGRTRSCEGVVLEGLVAFAVTAIAVSSGDVVYQNAASRLYWGDICTPRGLNYLQGSVGAGGVLGPFTCLAAKAALPVTATAAAAPPMATPTSSTGPAEAEVVVAFEPLEADSTSHASGCPLPTAAPAGTAADTVGPTPPVAAAALRTGDGSTGPDGGAHRPPMDVMSTLEGDVGASIQLAPCRLADPDGGGCSLGAVGCSGQALLQRLFALEPVKLERVLLDTCVEGRAWRGIVKVEVAANATRVTAPVAPSPRTRLKRACSIGVDRGTTTNHQVEQLLRSFSRPSVDRGLSIRDSLEVPALPRLPPPGPAASGPPVPLLQPALSSGSSFIPRSAQQCSRLQLSPLSSHTQRRGTGTGTCEVAEQACTALNSEHDVPAPPQGVPERSATAGDVPLFPFAGGGSTTGRAPACHDFTAANASLGRPASRKTSMLLLDTDPLATSVWSMLSADMTGVGAAAARSCGGMPGGGGAHGADGSEGSTAPGAGASPAVTPLSPSRAGAAGQERQGVVGPCRVEAAGAGQAHGLGLRSRTPSAGAQLGEWGQAASPPPPEGLGQVPEDPSAPLEPQPQLQPQALEAQTALAAPAPAPSARPCRQPSKGWFSAVAALRFRGADLAAELVRLEVDSRSESNSMRAKTAAGASEAAAATAADAWRALKIASASEAPGGAAAARGGADAGAAAGRHGSGRWDGRPSSARTEVRFRAANAVAVADGGDGGGGGGGGRGGYGSSGSGIPYRALAQSSRSFTVAARTASLTSMPRVVAFASSLKYAPQLPRPSMDQLCTSLGSTGQRMAAAAAAATGSPAAAIGVGMCGVGGARAQQPSPVMTGSGTCVSHLLMDNSNSLHAAMSSGLQGRGSSGAADHVTASPTFAEGRPAPWARAPVPAASPAAAIAVTAAERGGSSTGTVAASDILKVGSAPSTYAGAPGACRALAAPLVAVAMAAPCVRAGAPHTATPLLSPTPLAAAPSLTPQLTAASSLPPPLAAAPSLTPQLTAASSLPPPPTTLPSPPLPPAVLPAVAVPRRVRQLASGHGVWPGQPQEGARGRGAARPAAVAEDGELTTEAVAAAEAEAEAVSESLAAAEAEAEAQECWHEVTVTRSTDPATGQTILLLVQSDVTAKVVAERHIAIVSETEHRLLEQIFPRHVLAYMTEEGGPWAAAGSGAASPRAPSWRPIIHDINKLATSHKEVTLLFADIQGFTPMCKVLEPRVVMAFLNDLFTRFDKRLDEFGVYKVETIGDCYFVAGGLVHEDADGMVAVQRGEDRLHAERVFMFAKAMIAAASQVRLPTTGGPVRMRIGIHSGPVVSGVVGQRMPRFCLFGDTVNTTSRMESTGVAGCIHASEAAQALLRREAWVPTGGIEIKGKGLMKTYLWAPPDVDLCPEAAALIARYSAATASLAGLPLGPAPGAGGNTAPASASAASSAAASQEPRRGGSGAQWGRSAGRSCGSSARSAAAAAAEAKRSVDSPVLVESAASNLADQADSANALAKLLLSGS